MLIMNQIRMEATMDKKIAIPFDEPSRPELGPPELESCRATVNRWDMIDFESDFGDSLIWVKVETVESDNSKSWSQSRETTESN